MIKNKIAALLRRSKLMPIANRMMILFYRIKKELYLVINKSDIEAVYNKNFYDCIEEITKPTARNVSEILLFEGILLEIL